MSADPFNDPSTTTTTTTTGPTTSTPPTSSSPPSQPITSPSLTSGSASPPPAAAPGSTTTSPPPAVTTVSPPASSPQRQERDGPIDERVSNLRAMFPDYDDLILQSVLESVNWNQDRAIDTLLGMSDPEYKPQAPQQPQLTQTELDEQLARRLLLEDQHTHQQWLQQQQQQGPPQPGVPYQTRPGHQWSPQPTPGGGQGQGTGTGMQEISEQFNKIAETGKKTFGTLFNKVKAKIQEFDQSRPGAGSSQPPPQGHAPNHAWSQAQPTTTHAHVPSAQPAYYAPGPSPSPPQNPNPAPAPTRISPLSAVQGYDATPNREPSPKPVTTTSPPSAAVSSSSNGSTTAAALPASTTTAQPINASKFGLLPKRPVSLLRETPPPAEGAGTSAPKPAQPKPVDDGYDSDGLEYTENPFEETRK